MSIALVVCGACSRHVKRTESACPFCGATVAGARPSSGVPFVRMAAAAMVAAGAVAIVDCGDSSTPAYGAPGQEITSGNDASADATGPDGSIARDASADAADATGADGSTTKDDSGSAVALYGAPLFNDAAPATDDASDSGHSVIALYGAPLLHDAG